MAPVYHDAAMGNDDPVVIACGRPTSAGLPRARSCPPQRGTSLWKTAIDEPHRQASRGTAAIAHKGANLTGTMQRVGAGDIACGGSGTAVDNPLGRRSIWRPDIARKYSVHTLIVKNCREMDTRAAQGRAILPDNPIRENP
jgi:hypothetical protein